MVSRVPLLGGAGARAGLHRGSGGAGRVRVGSRARATPSCCSAPTGRSPATSGRGGRLRPAPPLASARGARGSRLRLERAGDAYLVRRDPGKTIVAGLSLVHRLGPRHVHRPPGALPRDRPPGRRAVHPARVGGPRLRGHAAQPLRGPGRRARVQHGRRVAVVCRRRRTSISRPPKPPAARRPRATARRSARAVQAILAGHVRGTRYGIRAADDGLLAAGEPGVQLTWMDAKVGDWVVTPRIGKPVEIQALWLNALRIAERFTPSYAPLYAKGVRELRAPLLERRGRLALRRGGRRPRAGPARPQRCGPTRSSPSAACRTPSSTASGPARSWMRSSGSSGRRSACARWRPARTATRPRYEGGVRERDGAYHQGTVWPWLLGPFVEAWVKVRGNGADVRAEARRRFFQPLLDHLDEAGRRPRLGDRRRGAAAHAAAAARSRRGRWARRSGSIGWFSAPASSPGGKAAACAARRSLSGRCRRAAPAPPMMRHLPEYLMEAALLGLFMISACTFTVLLAASRVTGARRHSGSVRAPAADGARHGRDGHPADLLPLGQAIGRAHESGDHAHLHPARQGRAARRPGLRGRAVRGRDRRRAHRTDGARRSAGRSQRGLRRDAAGPVGRARRVRRPRPASPACWCWWSSSVSNHPRWAAYTGLCAGPDGGRATSPSRRRSRG